MRIARWSLATLVTALGSLGLAAASAWPLRHHPPDAARLRLSWTARPERLETCRRLSDSELSALAPHMRQRVQCEGRSATYDLSLSVDGLVIERVVVHGGGLRRDRPIHFLDEYAVPAGARRLLVTFTRREAPSQDSTGLAMDPAQAGADTGLYAGRAMREDDERLRRGLASVPPRLRLDTLITLAPHDVALVTFDDERRQLVLRTSPTDR